MKIQRNNTVIRILTICVYFILFNYIRNSVNDSQKIWVNAFGIGILAAGFFIDLYVKEKGEVKPNYKSLFYQTFFTFLAIIIFLLLNK